MYEAAGAIRDRFAGRYFDTCSIVNARSGRCSENCKWCAQSAVFKTHVQEYELIDEESCMELARLNAKYGGEQVLVCHEWTLLVEQEYRQVVRVCREDQTGDEDKPLCFHGFADERAVAKIERGRYNSLPL